MKPLKLSPLVFRIKTQSGANSKEQLWEMLVEVAAKTDFTASELVEGAENGF